MKTSQNKKQKELIKSGDIFQLGTHRLACGDAKDKELVKKLLGKDKVSLILTDPPYGVAYVESKAAFKQKLSKEKIIIGDQLQSEPEYRVFTSQWIEAVKPYLEKKNSIYIFNSDKMLFALKEGMKDAACYFSQLLIWIKSQAVVGRMDYMPQHELIAYGWIGTHSFEKSKDRSVLFYPRPSRSVLHPTTKPVPLLRHLILNSSKTDGLVYDCFGGSGSTLIAAEQTKRKCITIELDPEYCQTIIDRFEKLTNTKAKKL
jgi:DNA modification methylase